MGKNISRNKETSRASARRKRDHLSIVLNEDVEFKTKSNGFEKFDFVHNALPELNLSDIDCSTTFLQKRIAAPVLISCMTGGFDKGGVINKTFASVCEELRIPMGVGSQRQVLDNDKRDRYFEGLRKLAPSIPLLGNIGAAEVALYYHGEYKTEDFRRIVDVLQADALVVHLNPLQELMQPEGNTNFRGVLDGIRKLIDTLPCPIMVKEVGAGISDTVMRRLIDAGVRHIDLAGAGGTSWAGIELLRMRGSKVKKKTFWDWGIPTCDALQMALPLKKEHKALHITASGGINDPLTAAKALAMGADLIGVARLFIETLAHGGKKDLVRLITDWMSDIKKVMFLTGSRTLADLQSVHLMKRSG